MNKREQELYKIFSKIDDPNEAKLFLKDILTDREREEVGQRWALIKELADGKSQRSVRDSVGTSIATVTRGAQMLRSGSGGFERMLQKEMMPSMEQNLNKIRNEIDKIDYKVIDLLAERGRLMPYVAQFKKDKKLLITQKSREISTLEKKKAKATKKGLSPEFIEHLFENIFEECKRLQIDSLLSHNLDKLKSLRKENKNKYVPVTVTLNTDTETPISLYRRFTKDEKYSFILESVGQDMQFSRYSFIGASPDKILEFKNGICKTSNFGGDIIKESECIDPLEVLKKEVLNRDLVEVGDLPRFIGGAVGFLGYDSIVYFEDTVSLPEEDDLDVADAFYAIYDELAIYDHKKRQIIFVKLIRLDDDLEDNYLDLLSFFTSSLKSLESPIKMEPMSANIEKDDISYKSDISKSDFEKLVVKAKKDIENGEVFQIVLSQRFEIDCEFSGFELYRSLRQVNPSSYLFYLNYPDYSVIGASPETFVQVDGEDVTLKALAGTKLKGSSDKENKKILEELKSDEKEIAEHMMLVDLARNDVGRVSEIGTVRVDKLMHISDNPYVYHLATDIHGKLKSDYDSVDILRACFPRGTLSGAPKIRAMQLISKYEKRRRGIYGGAVHYLDFRGNLDAAICIRTMLKKGNKIYVRAGAGIVHDSVPEKEYQETLNKAKGVFKSIQGVQQYGLKDHIL